MLDLPLPRRPYRVVASIPFAITTPLLGRLLDPPDSALRRAALVIGWGAARRFTDPRAGAPRSLWWRARFGIRIARRVRAISFSPPPGVDAAVLVVQRRSTPLVARRDQAPFLGLLENAFHERRAVDALAPIFTTRQLRRVLGDLSIGPHAPIESLAIEQWAAINAAMVALVDPVRWPRRKPSWYTPISVTPRHRGGNQSARGRHGSGRPDRPKGK